MNLLPIVYTFNDIETDAKIEPYRLWLRFSSSQLELKMGLQKINYGSAMLLRPLMWFDRIDSRDPLKLSDGVYGLLGRYYFLNNANIWLWGLYGNDEVKGWEIIPSCKHKIEYGGRLQVPIFNGEIALSYNHREADLSNQDPNACPSQKLNQRNLKESIISIGTNFCEGQRCNRPDGRI